MGSNRKAAVAYLVLVCSAAACSSAAIPPAGSTPGAATLDSSFPFIPSHSSASAAVTGASRGNLSVVITNVTGGADTCLAATAGSRLASSFQVVIDTSAREPGRYAFGDGWGATYRLANNGCATASEGAAVDGTLEIDSADTALRGIADVTFANGRIIASFDAPFCEAPTVASGCAQVPTCPPASGASPSSATEACLALP